MTALATDRDTRKKPGVLGEGPVAAAKTLYGGALVCVNAAGYLTPGDDAANLVLAGVSHDRYDNSAGANGDIDGVVERDGLHLMNMETAITQANVGDRVYIVDDQTVDLVANVTNNVFAGVIAEYLTTTMAYIDITPAVKQTDVFPHVPAAIPDPGDGEAIPVASSGVCAITTGGAETRTIAIPAAIGTKISLSMDVDGGDAVITAAAAVNQAGNNTITMADAGDYIALEAVQVAGALVWRVTENDGCPLSTV